MIRSEHLCAYLVAAVVLLAGPAGAAVTYSYTADPASYDVLPNETVSVAVYLTETIGPAEASPLADRGGLFSFDLLVEEAAAGTQAATILSAAINTAFDGDVDNAPPMIIANRSIFAPTGAPAAVADPVTRRVLLATLTIGAGGVVGETTAFRLADYENSQTPGTDTNTFYWDDITAEDPLDADVVESGFTVTVIPEPATLALLGLGALAVRRWRR